MKNHYNLKVWKEKHLFRTRYRYKLTITYPDGDEEVHQGYAPTKLQIYRFIRKLKKSLK